MDLKPMDIIKDLKQKNAELEKTKRRLEYQIQEMVSKSAQRSAKMDQTITELEIKIRDLEYDNRELKSEKAELSKRLKGSTASPETTAAGQLAIIDLETNDDHSDFEPSSLLEPMDTTKDDNEHYGEQRDLPFSCHLCSKSYIQKKRLETHLMLHQMESKSVEPKHQYTKKERFLCDFKGCNYSTTFFPVLVRHKNGHSYVTLSCDFYMCDYKTTSRKRYINHMSSKHGATAGHDMADAGDDDGDDDDQFSAYHDITNRISSSMQ